MKRLLVILAALVVLSSGTYFYLNGREVKVIDAHHGRYTVQILVNLLPLSTSDSIDWWIKNQKEILSKYNITPGDAGGPDSITVFAFGEGYQELGREDRLCFDDVKPPKNCIDKDILMLIYRDRNGVTKLRRHDDTYLLTKEGRIIKEKRD